MIGPQARRDSGMSLISVVVAVVLRQQETRTMNVLMTFRHLLASQGTNAP